MRYYTLKAAAELLYRCGETPNHIYELCIEKKLYSIPYEKQFMIPEDSMVRFLKYNPVYYQALCRIEEEESEVFMADRNYILDRYDETITIGECGYNRKQLANIFGVSIKEINKGLHKNGCYKIIPPKDVSATRVLVYLKRNPESLKYLEDRHDMLMANGDMMESEVRHLLMLYMYYNTHGYII